MNKVALRFFWMLLPTVCTSLSSWGQCAISLLSSGEVTCYGDSDGSASVVGSGASPFQYAWSSGGNGPFQNNLLAGTHSVTLTDNNGCRDSLTFFVAQPDSFGVHVLTTQPTCFGDSDGAIWLNTFGGTAFDPQNPDSLDIGNFTGPYTGGFTRGYHFTAPVSFRIRSLRVPTDIGTAPQSLQVIRFSSFPNQLATPFTTLWDTANVASTGAIAVDIAVEAGDEIGILGGRGTSSSLDGSYGPTGYTSNIAGFPIALERLYYQGNIANSFASSGSVGRQVGGVLGRVEMTYELPAYSYQWSTLDTTIGIFNASAGMYQVTITDSLGCQVQDSILLGQPDSLRIDSANIADIACLDDTAGGAIRLVVGGGTPATVSNTYRVDTAGTFAPVSGTFIPVSLADDQLLTGLPIGFAFQFYGQAHSFFNISSNGFLSFSGISDGCCAGQQLPATTFPNEVIAFAWEDLSPNLGGQVGYLQMGSAPYRKLVVEFDSVPHFGNTGDLVSAQVILYETTNIIEIHTRRMDNDGGPHTMGIENASGTQAVTRPGRNANGNWTATNDFVAFIPASAYSYVWSNGGVGSAISGLNTGAYTVTISDSLGCQLQRSFAVGVAATVQAGLTVSDLSCYGLQDGSAAALVSGAMPPYTLSWSNGDSVLNLSGLGPQSISYHLVDSFGCTAHSDTLVIHQPDSLLLQLSSSDARCEFDTNGQAQVAVSGGIGNYTYRWNDPAQQTTAQANSLVPGAYTVVVQDSNGCADTATINIGYQLSAPQVNFPSLDSVCLNQAPFPLTMASPPGGGYAGPGINMGQFNPAVAGPGVHFPVYTFTDSNGCQGEDTSYVNVKICAGMPEFTRQDWKVYPNPTQEHITWEGSLREWETGQQVELMLYDLHGAVQKRQTFTPNSNQQQRLRLDLVDLPAGTYFLEVRLNTRKWRQTIRLQ